MKRKDDGLRFVCPHCRKEYIKIGVAVEQVQSCLCPKCHGYCEIESLNLHGLMLWLQRYFGEEFSHDQKNFELAFSKSDDSEAWRALSTENVKRRRNKVEIPFSEEDEAAWCSLNWHNAEWQQKPHKTL